MHETTESWFVVPGLQPKQLDELCSAEEVHALLDSWAPATRRALAQLVCLYLTVDDVPSLAYAPRLAPLMRPLLEAGLVDEEDQEALHRWDHDWAPVPDGLKAGIAWNPTLITFVYTLIAGTPMDGDTFLTFRETADPQLRVFKLRTNEMLPSRVSARARAIAQKSFELLRERMRALDEYSYITFRKLAPMSTEGLDEGQLRERLDAIARLLRLRLEARRIVSAALAAREQDASSALAALDPIWREVVPDESVIVTDPDFWTNREAQ
jgi:hypothetical protein